jgi:hypothetical protein
MNADDLKKLTTESLNELATLLEQGHSERLTSMLKMMARFHRYSLHNVCLIVSQRPQAAWLASTPGARPAGMCARVREASRYWRRLSGAAATITMTNLA